MISICTLNKYFNFFLCYTCLSYTFLVILNLTRFETMIFKAIVLFFISTIQKSVFKIGKKSVSVQELC